MNDFLTEEDLKYFDEVEKTYFSCGESLRDTAVKMQISRTKVRKILITLGAIESEMTEKALGMINSGISQKKTAEILGVSAATLSTYLPYGNRVYNRNEKTPAALRTEECRARQASAALRQVSSVFSNERKMIMKPKEKYTSEKSSTVMKLHLELETHSEEEREIIRKYGKAEKTVSRDILVPGSMTLHALHYVIQKCFGWQNSHLHCFEYPQEVNDALLKNKFMNWVVLCGQYLRFPFFGDEALDDCYWDDDYSGGISFKTWLQKKYTGPYYYGGYGEQYAAAHSQALEYISENKEISLGPTVKEYFEGDREYKTYDIGSVDLDRIGFYFEHNMNELLERLKLSELLTKDVLDTELAWNTAVSRSNGFDEYFKKWCGSGDRKAWSASNTPDVIPLSDTLLYNYDYGDGWHVVIKCEEIYRITETRKNAEGVAEVNYSISLSEKRTLKSDETEKLLEVCRKLYPVCIAADGLPVMDDVGGTGGYCRLLEQIYDPAMSENDGGAERDELIAWARAMGWNARKTSPEKLL